MQSAADARSTVLELVPSDEERMMRDTVGAICSGFGPSTRAASTRRASRPPSCGTRSPRRGYLGVNIPEEYGGGGLGMARWRRSGEEIAAAGSSLLLIVVSPAIVGSILARHGTRRAEGPLAARASPRARPRSRSRSPSPTPAPTRTTSPPSLERDGDRFVLSGQKTYISGVEDADAVLVVARSRLPDGKLGLPSLCHRGRGRARASRAR